MGNFFQCIKDRSKPISDVWFHHRAVSACQLANIAIRVGRKVRWDPVKQDFIGNQEASAMLRRPQREPYAVDA